MANQQPIKSFRRDFRDPGSGLWDLMANIVLRTGDATMDYVVGDDPSVENGRRILSDVADLLGVSSDQVLTGVRASSMTFAEIEALLDAAVDAPAAEADFELEALDRAVGYARLKVSGTSVPAPSAPF